MSCYRQISFQNKRFCSKSAFLDLTVKRGSQTTGTYMHAKYKSVIRPFFLELENDINRNFYAKHY